LIEFRVAIAGDQLWYRPRTVAVPEFGAQLLPRGSREPGQAAVEASGREAIADDRVPGCIGVEALLGPHRCEFAAHRRIDVADGAQHIDAHPLQRADVPRGVGVGLRDPVIPHADAGRRRRIEGRDRCAGSQQKQQQQFAGLALHGRFSFVVSSEDRATRFPGERTAL